MTPKAESEDVPIITFCGRELPKSAIFIELALNNDFVVAKEEEAAWWWRFTICSECVKTEGAQDVHKHAKYMQAVLRRRKREIREMLLDVLTIDAAEAERIWQEWRATSIAMAELSAHAHECSWTGSVAKVSLERPPQADKPV